ncbi:unnamed protein product [Rotaria sp. Silwood2]|nr:unnamed protein product [Rotaria sp. Silwood2]CAF4410588.1 unnamed protein product [Rotaria sp. Silwood2]CAF4471128.1 unnamed protein product [Rotaria sp. Silwood2]
MTRVQMDLIDMRSRPDHVDSGKIFKWIIQLKDHFTKCCWAQPLETKEAREVYSIVRNIFFNFGPPRILQSDNGPNIDTYSSPTNKRSISSINVPSSSQTFGPLVTIDESRHDIIRESGRINYLKSQSKRQKIYDEYLNTMANLYSKGDLIGIPVDKVDRTNCDAKLMPCLIEERVDHGAIPSYRLISPYGRLSTLFAVHQLIPLTNPIPDSLLNIDKTNTPTVSFVHACKMFARSAIAATCYCKTKCNTKTCPCQRLSIRCSTKCHPKRGKCTNKD